MVELLSEFWLVFEEAGTRLSVNFAGLMEFVRHFEAFCKEMKFSDGV
jgi:hypothetical protein